MTQETSVASAAMVSDSQKLCRSARTEAAPPKIWPYHLAVKPMKRPDESKNDIDTPFGMKP